MQSLITMVAVILGGGGAALLYQWRVHRRDQRILAIWERAYVKTPNTEILSRMFLSGRDAAPPTHMDAAKHDDKERGSRHIDGHDEEERNDHEDGESTDTSSSD